MPDFKQLKTCRKEVKMLKTLWDYVYLVRTSVEDWKTTPWESINVEQMDMDCKKFAKVCSCFSQRKRTILYRIMHRHMVYIWYSTSMVCSYLVVH